MNKANNIFEMFDNINKNLLKKFDEFNEMKNNALKEYVGEGIHNEVTFKYDTKLEPEDKKKIIIDKLNRWNKLARVFGNDTVVKFEFGKDEIFYFTWDKDYNGFVTVDPNGDKFFYNAKDETLNKIVEDEKKDENEKKQDENENARKPSGVRSDVVDKTIIPCEIPEMEEEGIEKDFGLKDDKNLASNLRNALRNSYAEFKEKNEKCEEIFCPFGAAENFKADVIDQAAYETDFDDNDNPIQIKFDISWLLSDYEYDTDEYYIAIDDIYHNESANLDKFCELIKEKYNFSLGSWNVKFDEDKDVHEIQFIFTF